MKTDNAKHPFASVCEAWLAKIDLALQKKQDDFGQFADECAKFYDGPPDFMWNEEKARAKSGGWLEQGVPFPSFRMQLNKAAEAVSLYGPALFHQYPNVLVQPVPRPEIMPEAMGIDMANPIAQEMLQQRDMARQVEQNIRLTHGNIAASYLNRVQQITDKKSHSRYGITDGMVRGLGCLHTKIYSPPGSNIRYPRSEYVSECDYVKDSDATRHEDVQYVAVRCVAPVNKVAEEYGLDPKELKGHYQSHESQVRKKSKKDAKSGTADKSTFDLIEYWEVYSKNGFGDKLTTFSGKDVDDYSVFGPHCYLVVARGVPYPLNLPSWALTEEEPEQLFDRVQWPIPFWTPPLCDWPVSELGFLVKGGSIYPVPMFKPLIGLIRFVNWCMSFLADKAAAAGTDYIVAVKSAAEEIKKQIENGVGPYKMLEIPQAVANGVDVSKLVSVLSAPNFHEALWRMVSDCIALIDRLSGLNELLAGMTTTQMRSAEEAAIKQSNTQIRPDDMAQKVEDWLTLCAKKEILAAQWVLEPQDIAAVVGDEAAEVWAQQMMTQDPERLISDFEFTIEAGSARKPNIANKQRALSEMWQSTSQVAAEMAMGGNPGPWNAYWKAWGQVNQMDTGEFVIQPPDPNAPQPPDPEQQKAEAEIAKSEAELGMAQQRLQMDIFGKVADLQMKREEHQMDLAHDSQRFSLELKHDKAKSQQDLAINKQKGQAQVQAAKAKARATPSKNGSKT